MRLALPAGEPYHIAGADAGGQLRRGGRDSGATGAARAGDAAAGAQRAAGAENDLAGAGSPVEGAALTTLSDLGFPRRTTLPYASQHQQMH